MDARHFDTLVRSLSEHGSRRGLLALLAGLPLLGGLAALRDLAEVAAKGRRKRRKKPHHHRKHTGNHKGKHKKHKQRKCKPQSLAQTCAGTCGQVKNNCKKTVDCGSCACDPPCPVCQVCNEETSVCEPDPNQQDDACGEPGQVCQSNGACACDAMSCPSCTICGGDGACQGCAGCCDGATCVAECDACQTCDDGQCASCAAVGQLCCDGVSCNAGACCTNAECEDPNAPLCAPDHTCQPCTSDPDGCPGATCCDADTGECVAICPASDPICGAGNVCVPCENHGECGADALCVDGQCQSCDATCPGGTCAGADLQTAVNGGDTVYVCPGRYTGSFTLNTDLTLIGAGQGNDEAVDTILDAQESGGVMRVLAGVTAAIVSLRVTGGLTDVGGGIWNQGTKLTVTDCTVADNTAQETFAFGGGIFNEAGSVLEMTGCTIADNKNLAIVAIGGGIANFGQATLTDCTLRNTKLGGALINSGGAATATLTGCTVTLNETFGIGNGAGAELTVEDTAVTFNTNPNSVGGVSNDNDGVSQVTLTGTTTVTDNTSINCLGPINGAAEHCGP